MQGESAVSASRATGVASGESEPGDIVRAIATTDLVMVVIAVVVALVAGWGAGGPLSQDPSRQTLAIAVLIAWPLVLWQRQTRVTSVLGAGVEEYRRVLVASAWMVMLAASFAYFTDTTRARVFLVGTAVLGTVLLLGGRWVMRRSLRRTLRKGHPIHRVFVVASPTQLEAIRSDLSKSENRYAEVGSVTDHGIVKDPKQVVQRALAARADTILYMPFAEGDPSWTRRLGWALEDTDLHLMVSPAVVEIAGPRLRVQQVEGLALLSVENPQFSGPAKVVKRSLDLLGVGARTSCVGGAHGLDRAGGQAQFEGTGLVRSRSAWVVAARRLLA